MGGEKGGDGDGDTGGATGDGGDTAGVMGDGDGDTGGATSDGGDTAGVMGDGDGDTGGVMGDGDGDGETGGLGNGTGGTSLDDPLVVVGVTPHDGARAVARDSASITLQFNQALDEESIDSNSIFVTGPQGPVTADIQVSGKNVELELEDSLLLLATYSIHVLTGVKDALGDALDEEFISSFTTKDGSWTPTAPVEDDEAARIGDAAPETGIASNGDMLVVYHLQNDGQLALAPHARWYRQSTGWEAPLALDADQTNPCNDLNVSVNASGDAVAAWRCDDVAYVRQYRGGAWESSPQTLPDDASGRIHVQMLPSGAVIGVYQHGAADYFNHFWATEETDFDVQADLGVPGPGQYDVIEFDSFALSSNASGNALLLWAIRDSESSARSIVYRRYAASNHTWTQPALITRSTSTDGQLNPVGALADDNEAMAIWVDVASSSNHNLMASQFTLAGGWGAPVEIDALDAPIHNQPRLVREGNGEYLAVFPQRPAIANLYASRFGDGTWTRPVLVSDGIQEALQPLLASDGRGNSLVVWGYDLDTTIYTDPLVLQSWRYSHATKDWADTSPAPDEQVYISSMGLHLAPSGYGALTWIGIQGTVYRGTPDQRIDVSVKRFE